MNNLRTAVLAAILLSAGVSSASSAVLIKIDKAEQRMSVSVNGEERHSWPVSTGRAGYSTPKGSFTAFRMAKEHFSKEWDDAPMPHSIFFTSRGHAVHGSLETRRLGTPASHGCVRLEPTNAETLFNLVKEDGLSTTKVEISGEEPAAAVAKRRPATREASRPREKRTREAFHRRKRVRVVEVRRSRSRGRIWSQPVYAAPVYGGDYWGWNPGWN